MASDPASTSVSRTLSISKEPVPGIPIFESEEVPGPEDKIIGYKVVEPKRRSGFTKPRPGKMNKIGWAFVAICALLFCPAACVPCCMACAYSAYQVPVYGQESAAD